MFCGMFFPRVRAVWYDTTAYLWWITPQSMVIIMLSPPVRYCVTESIWDTYWGTDPPRLLNYSVTSYTVMVLCSVTVWLNSC